MAIRLELAKTERRKSDIRRRRAHLYIGKLKYHLSHDEVGKLHLDCVRYLNKVAVMRIGEIKEQTGGERQ